MGVKTSKIKLNRTVDRHRYDITGEWDNYFE